MRERRYLIIYIPNCRITPPELQFKNPLDARNSNYSKMK